MERDAFEALEHNKGIIRSYRNDRVVNTFRFHDVGIADMDRAELIGVISQLIIARSYNTMHAPLRSTYQAREQPSLSETSFSMAEEPKA